MLIIMQTLGWFLFFFISDFLLPTLNTQLIVRINLTEFNRNICCRGKCEFSFFLTEGPKFLNHHKGTNGKKLFMTTRYGLFLFSFAKLFHDDVSNLYQGYLGTRK